MPLRSLSIRSVVMCRRLGVVTLLALAGMAIPAAHARNTGTHRHPRLHALTHAFLNVALPGIGFLPDYGDPVPEDGQKYEIKLEIGRASCRERV